MSISRTLSLIFAATTSLVVASAAHAQPMPGKHPAYLHALSDLREARGLLERPVGTAATKWDEKIAIKEIDAAIKEIKDAAIDDGKNLGEHPPVDTKMDWSGRLHAAQKLLTKAHQDTDQDEDNSYARGLKHRALQHIDGATSLVNDGITENESAMRNGPAAGEGGRHPAYLHALTDLREARANLTRPNGLRAKWDEHRAIREIDAAIKEIKEAAIDDGKNVDEHPPIDANLDWGGRLHHTFDLLDKARADIEQKEDNKWARGLKKRANQHIQTAIGYLRQGMAEKYN